MSILDDTLDPYAGKMIDALRKVIQVSDSLKKWDGNFRTKSEEATLYTLFLSNFYDQFLTGSMSDQMREYMFD
jgi:acyl-homoserine lactone acylase PvdQ